MISNTKDAMNTAMQDINSFIKNAAVGYKRNNKAAERAINECEEKLKECRKKFKDECQQLLTKELDLENKISKARERLISDRKIEKNIQKTPEYKKYRKDLNKQAELLKKATLENDKDKIDKINATIHNMREEFANTTVGKHYCHIHEEIKTLKKEITLNKTEQQKTREARLELGDAAKEKIANIISDKQTSLDNIKKQGKFTKLVGFLASRFGGQKGFKKRAIDPIKEKVGEAKDIVSSVHSMLSTEIQELIVTVSSIDIKSEINSRITSIADNINTRINNLAKSINEEAQDIENKINKNNENKEVKSPNKQNDSAVPEL